MKKKVGIIKRLFCLLLIFLLSINSFAAIVSDNDGSAFITKAEFDALKSSFQSQIDSYNQSIDSKIDGAIASYLAGIKLSSIVLVDNLSYVGDGIYSLTGTADDGNWVQGRMQITGQYAYTRCGGVGGTLNWSFASKPTQTSFREWLICNRNADKSAEFFGYYDTNLSMRFWAMQFTAFNWVTDYQTKFCAVYQVENGTSTKADYRRKNNVDLSTNASTLLAFHHGGGDSITQGTAEIAAKYCSFQRQLVAPQKLNVVLANNSCDWKVFSEQDQFRDWETQIETLSYVSMASKLSTEEFWTMSAGFLVGGGNRGTVGTIRLDYNDTKTYSPWVGPTTQIQNWDKIYKGGTSDLVADIKTKNATWTGLQGNDGKYYLPINAGAPIAAFNAGQVVQIPLEFEDKSKNYDVWIKCGPFTSATSTATTIAPSNISGASASPTYSNAIRVTSGLADISFTMPEDNYIFIKWSIAGASPIGGGTWLPSRSVSYLRES